MGGRALALALAVSFSGGATTVATAADDYPSKPITIVVPTSPGEPADALSRILAELIRKDLGQPVVVTNIVGGGGAKGQLAIKAADADGYMIINNWVSTQVVTPLFNKDVGYGIDDFEPIAGMLQLPFILVTSASNPATDLESFLVWAKEQDRPIRFGGCDALSLPRMIAEKFVEVAGIEAQGIPFAGCMPDNVKAVLDGSVDFSITVPNATKVFGSQITVLAALAENRLPVLPDAPTAKEQGVDLGLGDASQGWGGFAIKAGTPDDRRDKLVAVFEKWLKSDEFTEKAVALNLTPHYSTPAEFRVTWELGREGLAPLVEKLLKSGN